MNTFDVFCLLQESFENQDNDLGLILIKSREARSTSVFYGFPLTSLD